MIFFINGFEFTLGAIAALFFCFVFMNFCKGFVQAFGKSYREAVDKRRAEKEIREVKSWPETRRHS